MLAAADYDSGGAVLRVQILERAVSGVPARALAIVADGSDRGVADWLGWRVHLRAIAAGRRKVAERMRRLLLPREWSPLRYSELWQEEDALFYVHSSRFSDRYAHYCWRDIQAFVLTEYPLWNGFRAAWLGISFFFTLVLLLAPPGAWKLWALFPGVFLVTVMLRLHKFSSVFTV